MELDDFETGTDFETETCVGCGLTVEVSSPIFLEWDADVAGWSICPDCRAATNPAASSEPESEAGPEVLRSRAA